MNWKKRFRDISKDAVFGAASDPVLAQVQQMLNDHGASPPLVTDGVYGPKTQAALQHFQQINGLPISGIVDAATMKKLGISSPTQVSGPPPIPKVPMPAIPGIKQAALDAFMNFIGKFEGNQLTFMYTDSLGLVTTGSGNLIDGGPRSTDGQLTDSSTWNYGPALSLPWRNPDGSLATQAEIIDAWTAVKSAYPEVQSVRSQSLTSIRLNKEDIAKLISNKLTSMVSYLRTKYPGLVNWPADAQLGLLDMSWNMGEAFNFPNFTAAVNQPTPDFLTAAKESHISNADAARNAANNQLFTNAAQVLALGKKGNANNLYYPDPVTAAVIAIGIAGLITTIGMGGVTAYLYYKKLWPFGGPLPFGV